MKDKCEIGETNFISPPRLCAPNLWRDTLESYKKRTKEMKKKYPYWDLKINLNK